MKINRIILGLCVSVVFLAVCNRNSGYLEDEITQETMEEESKIDVAKIKAQYVRLPKNEGEIQYEIEEKKIVIDGHSYLLGNNDGIYLFSLPGNDASDKVKEDKFRVW